MSLHQSAAARQRTAAVALILAASSADAEDRAIAERIANSERMLEEGARRYAAADPSDPFAYARAKAHIKTGIGSIDPLKKDCVDSYDAESGTESRVLPEDGERTKEERTYQVVVYRNRRRP